MKKIVWNIVIMLGILIAWNIAFTQETSQQSTGKPEESAMFEISERILQELQKLEMPEDVLTKLQELESRSFATEKDFAKVLEELLGKEVTEQYKTDILKAAYRYDSTGRREPFKPPFETDPTPVLTPLQGSCDTPLGQFDLGQFKIIGIILGADGDRARIEAPDGESYTITMGACLGKASGKVTAFTDNCITIVETKRFKKDDEIIEEVSEHQLCLKPLEEE